MIHYLEELNYLDARKERRPLDLTNIIYWFKNARAAHRRASRQYDGDGSFDLKVGQRESSPNGNHTLPYLPNKNAVYMLPYPIHGHYPTPEESRLRLSQDYDQSGLGSDDQSDIIKREIH